MENEKQRCEKIFFSFPFLCIMSVGPLSKRSSKSLRTIMKGSSNPCQGSAILAQQHCQEYVLANDTFYYTINSRFMSIGCDDDN